MEHDIRKCVCVTCCNKRLTMSRRQLHREQYPDRKLGQQITSLGVAMMVCGFIAVFFMVLIGLLIG